MCVCMTSVRVKLLILNTKKTINATLKQVETLYSRNQEHTKR